MIEMKKAGSSQRLLYLEEDLARIVGMKFRTCDLQVQQDYYLIGETSSFPSVLPSFIILNGNSQSDKKSNSALDFSSNFNWRDMKCPS